jgi:Ger(x)C family germination protein
LFFGGFLVRDIFKKATLGGGVLLTMAGVFAVSPLPLSREEIFAKIDYMYMTSGVFFLIVLPLSLIIAAKITTWGHNKILAKTAAFMLMLIFILTMLSGCWDRVEIENRAFVVAMAIDKDENYAVTLSVPLIGENEDDEEEKPAHIKKATGKTITEALKKLDAKNDKSLYYGQTKLIILGESLLSDRALLQGAINTLGNKLEATRRIHVLSAENAGEILEAKPPGEILPGSYIADIYRDKDKIGGQAFALDFERLSTILNSTSTGDAIIPKVKRNENELRLSGATVLKNREKIATLSPKQLQGLLWCFPDANQGAIVTADNISMKIEKHKAKITFQQKENTLQAIIEIQAKGTVDDYPEAANEFTFAQQIAKEITTTAEILQKIGTDGYNWFEHLRKKNYPLYKKHAENQQEIFQTMEIVPIVTVEITS